MNKKISIYILALIFLLAGCNGKPNNKNSETGTKQVENKDINISGSKKKPIPEVAKNLDDALKIFHNHNFGEANMDSINIDKIKGEFTNELFILNIEGFKDGKIYKLLTFAGRSDDVSDPWYSRDFGKAYSDIEEGCQGLLRFLMDKL